MQSSFGINEIQNLQNHLIFQHTIGGFADNSIQKGDLLTINHSVSKSPYQLRRNQWYTDFSLYAYRNSGYPTPTLSLPVALKRYHSIRGLRREPC